jgi:hypothetical protein
MIMQLCLYAIAERIPISTYEELQPLIERTRTGEQNVLGPIKWFAKSAERPMPKVNLSL